MFKPIGSLVKLRGRLVCKNAQYTSTQCCNLCDTGAIVTRCTEEGDGALYLATFGLLSWKWSRIPHLGVIEDLIKAGEYLLTYIYIYIYIP